MAGVRAFRKAYVSASDLASLDGDYGSWDARLMRYAILWAYFEQSQYDSIHRWSTAYKAEYGLYKHLRAIYAPGHRLGTFWQTHLMGGLLDPDAGDGKAVPSALPIATENAKLRNAIAHLWKMSNWQVNKDIWTLRGAVLGDSALRVRDDVARQAVYLELVHPSIIKSKEEDSFGHVKGYTLEEERADPENKRRSVTYSEIVTRDGDNVVYQTLLNGSPYAWPGQVDRSGNAVSTWSEPYGFVPFVTVQHANVGLDWGWSELYPALGKMREVDDLASKLHDQMRKLVDAPMLLTGMVAPKEAPRTRTSDPTDIDLEPGRQQSRFLYSTNENTRAVPLTGDLDLGATAEEIGRTLAELEGDYPELQYDRRRFAADVAAASIREARKPAEVKTLMRRTPYDQALVRMQQMAVAIGGWRGYPQYAGFDLDSYQAGGLDHAIGKRPVFSSDPMDDIEEQAAFWTAAESAGRAGLPLAIYLARAGWSPADIAQVKAAKQAEAQEQERLIMQRQQMLTDTAPQGEQ